MMRTLHESTLLVAQLVCMKQGCIWQHPLLVSCLLHAS